MEASSQRGKPTGVGGVDNDVGAFSAFRLHRDHGVDVEYGFDCRLEGAGLRSSVLGGVSTPSSPLWRPECDERDAGVRGPVMSGTRPWFSRDQAASLSSGLSTDTSGAL